MSKFLSRKFLVAVISAVVLICNQGLGLNISEDNVMSVSGIIIAYLISQGWVDSKK